MLSFENDLWNKGFRYIAGVDEAGRGPLAGPVIAAAVIFSPGQTIVRGIADSKMLSAQKREAVHPIIESTAIGCGIGMATEQEIDALNIFQASLLAMKRAVNNLQIAPEYLLIDGRHAPGSNLPAITLVKGDNRSMSVAAASILAKVCRDKIMENMDLIYPEYGFARHKGYPTKQHIEAILKYGLCPIHRRTFRSKALADIYGYE